MKKLLIVLALAGVATFANAQETTTDPVEKYSVATNSFWSNWFIQAGFDWNAWYSNEEHGQNLARGPWRGFRSTPGFSVAIGKWFTPGLGLRTKFSGVWGRTVTDDNKDGNDNKMWILNEQVLFNLSNMLCGYNPDRVWNVIPFIGAGIGRNCTYDRYSMNLGVGLISSWRVSKHVNIYLEGGWNRFEGDADGVDKSSYSGIWENKDNHLYAEVGLNFNLGKASWNKVPDVDAIKALSQSQIDALNAQLNDANAENARLKSLLANQKNDEAKGVKEFVTAPVSVFFNINRSNIASKKDLVNVKAMAKYAKDNEVSLLVKGYADSATGSASYNKRLSEKRAETVANELVKMGVSRDKISTEGLGGVKELSPISFNRRATVQVKD